LSAESKAFQEQALRDYLRSPQEVEANADLKKALALKFCDDRSAYVSGKGAFVAEVVGRAMTAYWVSH
jgi:GrpB-like predicted nucleotidyltransferase (UPF0157 family)